MKRENFTTNKGLASAGFGQRPAVMVIDMQHDFCDPNAPTTRWPSIAATYEPSLHAD
jgi:hypothetical protein